MHDPTIDPVTGKKCKVCTSFKNWSKQESENLDNSPKKPKIENDYYIDCPPEATQLGRSTWTFLHTMAAYYPTSPTSTQQSRMKLFLETFSEFYPCNYCATHLQQEMKVREPRVGSNVELSQWMCEVHNEVNERLGKPKFDCAKALERWRDGPKDGRCD